MAQNYEHSTCQYRQNDIQCHLVLLAINCLIARPRFYYLDLRICIIVKMLLEFALMTAIILYTLFIKFTKLHEVPDVADGSASLRIELLPILAINPVLNILLLILLLSQLLHRLIRRDLIIVLSHVRH